MSIRRDVPLLGFCAFSGTGKQSRTRRLYRANVDNTFFG